MIKKILIGLVLIVILIVAIGVWMDKPLPKGVAGAEAELMADKILTELNKQAWDSLPALKWSHPFGHDYIWDKQRNLIQIRWSDYRVLISPNDGRAIAYENSQLIDDESVKSKAFEYFYNDSFWLIAPFKIKDPGTIRKLVDYEGEKALLVQYTSGGVTPGDSYLWIVDSNYKPKAWRFWASIVPIGGMYFTWEGWQQVEGAWISTQHSGLVSINIKNLQGAKDIRLLNNGIDPFDGVGLE